MNRLLSEQTVALVVAAGRGLRSGLDRPKQYCRIGRKSVLAHAVDALAASPLVDRIVPVIHASDRPIYDETMGKRRLENAITGGATRRASVLNGLEAIAQAGGAKFVLIHDAARPFLPKAVVTRLTDALGDADGAVPVLPVVDTLSRDGRNIDRTNLMRVQTPQAFRFDSILAAHRNWEGPEPTDDAEVARHAGLRMAEVTGDERLKKLTLAEDFEWADKMLSATMTSRTGMGFDVHAFGPGDHLWLGGIRIDHERGLIGHSDADVVLHALVDALLGAISEGDIGTHFPPSDPQWHGASSRLFLEHARDLVTAGGGTIDHADITIICEEPKIGPHREAIRALISETLRVPASRISIKATTTEKLGFTGRREGIAAQAIATVRMPHE